MTPEEAYQWLVEHSKETAYFISMGQVLGWDQRTYIPPKGHAHRHNQFAMLAKWIHARATDPQVEEVLAQAELKGMFRQKLSEFRTELNGKELDILDLRLLAEKPMTLQEIGARHHISRERVRQIEDRLIKRLRQHLKNEIADWEDYRTPMGD